MDNSFIIDDTPSDVLRHIGEAARRRRLAAGPRRTGLSQVALAAKAGVSIDAIKRLETTGRSSLETLVRLTFALGDTTVLQSLFSVPDAQSIAELEARHGRSERIYARRRDAGRRKGKRPGPAVDSGASN